MESSSKILESIAGLVGLAFFLGTGYAIYMGYEWVTYQPIELTSLGGVRIYSCEYKGVRLGGKMYSCFVKNQTDEPVKVEASCGSFDKSNRLLGRSESISELSGVVFRPSEERVVNVFFPEDATRAECIDNGELYGISDVDRNIQKLTSKNLATRMKI